MINEITDIRNQTLDKISRAKDAVTLAAIRRDLLGKPHGRLTLLFKTLPKISPEEKATLGTLINQAKTEVESALSQRERELKMESRSEIILDPTAPGRELNVGRLHLVTEAIREIAVIFERLGFIRRRYPEVETDWYAFEGLNMPENHPARDEWETFFIADNIVLTPHTSSGQLREMERKILPIRMINISRCDRRQSDINHIPTFYQFEGLLIDKNITIANLKGVLEYFVREFFGGERKIRLRPYDFRFTEPSFEIDVNCGLCQGIGCRYCKAGFAELGGAGMVHPAVLQNGGIDPKKYGGFAFGWGVERTYLMRSGVNIPDIRLIYKNDIRFLEQF